MEMPSSNTHTYYYTNLHRRLHVITRVTNQLQYRCAVRNKSIQGLKFDLKWKVIIIIILSGQADAPRWLTLALCS